MAIAVDQNANFAGAFGASRTFNFSVAPGSTDLIVIGFVKESTSAVTAPSGFTTVSTYVNTGSNVQTGLHYKYGDTSNSYAFSWTGSATNYMYGVSLTGASSTQFDATSSSWTEANFSEPSIPSITTTNDGALHMLWTFNSNDANGTAPTGYTKYFGGGSGFRCQLATKIISPAGATGAKTHDVGTEFYTSSYALAITPTGGGGGPVAVQQNMMLMGVGF